MASVQVADMRRVYGATPIIHGVDIDIDDGEFVILVGSSGCGERIGAEPGEKIHIRPDTSAARLFDAKTGDRLN